MSGSLVTTLVSLKSKSKIRMVLGVLRIPLIYTSLDVRYFPLTFLRPMIIMLDGEELKKYLYNV